MCIENANSNKKHHVNNNDIQRELRVIGGCREYRKSIEICRNSMKGKLFTNFLLLQSIIQFLMIIQYKYLFNGYFDLAQPDAKMVSKCIDSEFENVTSLEAMVKSGWEIDLNSWFNKSNSGIENQIYAKECGYHTFWGYKYGRASGSVSAALKGSGIATLDFGSCGDSGITAVYLKRPFLNYVRLGIAEGSKREISKIVTFSYEPGYILKIEEERIGIIKINSLKLRCNGS